MRLASWKKPKVAPDANEAGREEKRRAPPRITPTGRLRDSDIRIPFVRLVDPTTHELGPPLPLRQVIDHARKLSAIAPDDAADASEGASTEEGAAAKKKSTKYGRKYAVELVASKPEAVVKLVDLQEEYRRLKDEHKKKREGPKAVEEKEVQMTWGVAAADLEHKLRKVREALDEGDRVAIAFSRKKGQVVLKREEMQMKMQELVDKLEPIAVEYKQRAFTTSSTALIYMKPR